MPCGDMHQSVIDALVSSTFTRWQHVCVLNRSEGDNAMPGRLYDTLGFATHF